MIQSLTKLYHFMVIWNPFDNTHNTLNILNYYSIANLNTFCYPVYIVFFF